MAVSSRIIWARLASQPSPAIPLLLELDLAFQVEEGSQLTKGLAFWAEDIDFSALFIFYEL